MSKSKLSVFETMVLLHPTAEEAKQGKETKIIVEFERILAKNQDAVSWKMIKKVDDKYDPEQVEIIVRSFVKGR